MQISFITKKNFRALFALSTIPMYYREIAEFVYGDGRLIGRAKGLIQYLKRNGWAIEVTAQTATMSREDVVLINKYYEVLKYNPRDVCRVDRSVVAREVYGC